MEKVAEYVWAGDLDSEIRDFRRKGSFRRGRRRGEVERKDHFLLLQVIPVPILT